jgi:glycosyltransferase involved in cell wall biosynthesis
VNILHSGKTMRIAVISTPFVRVPPNGYGGTELFCGQLAETLLARGHDVTLFATGDSQFSGELSACFPKATWPPTESVDRAHVRFCLHEISRDRQGYDAVQINSVLGLKVARDLGIPVVYTLHHHRDEAMSRLYAVHPEVHYVAISRRQLDREVPLRHASVIHHGLDVADYAVSSRDEGYLLHLGRFAPEKGTHLAIDAALAAKTPIVIAGRVHEKPEDQAYFDTELVPRFNLPGVILGGEADPRRKIPLLQQARAVLCPITWEEPFGLIAIEAMLVGTPVIGFARGAFPEIIEDGVTGILVSDVQEMTRAIPLVARFDREKCAARARERFSAERMAADYERVFESIGRRRSSPVLVAEKAALRQTRLIG